MSTYDGVTGAQRLLAFGSYTAGYCLQAVARAIFGGTPTKSTHTPPHVVDQALDVWNIAPASRRHPGDRNPPAGALLLYGKRKGHIAIGTGGDRQVSTDWPSNGKIGVATIEQIEKSWGQTYLGWTDYLEGDDVTYVYPAPPASPSPTQRVVKIEQATRRDIPATNGTQLETMHAGFVHDYPAFVRSPLEGGTVGGSNVWFDGGGWFMHSSMFTDPSTTGITDETDVLYPPVVETPPPSSNDQATTEPEIPATTGDDAPSTPDPSDSDQASGPSGAEIDDSHTAVIPVTPDDPQLTPSKPTNPATPAYRPISQEDIMTLNTLPSISIDDAGVGALVENPATRKRIYNVWIVIGLILFGVVAAIGASAVSAVAAVAAGWPLWLVVLVAFFAGVLGAYGALSPHMAILARANVTAPTAPVVQNVTVGTTPAQVVNPATTTAQGD